MLSSNNQIILADATEDGEYWLTNWQYREKMTFEAATGADTNYPFEIIVYHDVDDGTDGVDKVCTEGNALANFDDIRFTGSDGNTVLDYYRNDYTASTSAIFWFELKEDVSSGTVVAYVYYGNAGASYIGDGDDVFLFFDDFENNNMNKWDTVSGAATTSAKAHTGTYSADLESGEYIWTLGHGWTRGIMIHYQMYADNSLRGGTVRWTSVDDADHGGYVRLFESGTSEVYYYDGAYKPWTNCADLYQDDTWYEYEIGCDQNYVTPDPDMRLFMEGGYIGEEDMHETDDTDFENENIDDVQVSSQTNYHNWIDDFWVRKWQVIEPYISTWSAEETAEVINVGSACTNPDDTNHLYAKSKMYVFTANITILSGATDIEQVFWRIKSSGGTTRITVLYVEATDIFTQPAGTTFDAELDNCEVSKSGIYLDLTIPLEVLWTAENEDECYISVSSYDDFGGSDLDDFGDYDVETRLDVLDYGLDDGSGTAARGNYNSEDSITASGTVVYFGSSVNPPSDEIDVWILCADVADSPWSDLTLSSGVYSMTVDSDDVVGFDTYTIKVVQEGAGSGGADEAIHVHTATYVADHMIFIATVSETWVMVDETITVTMSGKYAYPDGNDNVPSQVWSNADSGEVTYSTTGLRDWYIVSTGDTHGITSITNTSASCLWDDVLMSSLPAYKWTQYSPDEVWLIINTAKFTWYGNSSNAVGVLIQSLINGTEDDWGIISSEGYIGDLVLGGNPTNNAFDASWFYANISLQAKITGHERIIWVRILKVDILHSIQIVDSGFYLTDNWVIITIQINWNNGTFFVWDNVTGTPVLVGASYMGTYPFARSSVIGLHTLIVLVNGTHETLDSSAQVADGSDAAGWKYLEFPYTINPITFCITELLMMQNNESIIVSGFWHTPNTTLTWIAYEAGVFIDSGVLTLTSSGEYNAIYWLKNAPTTFINFTLSITADGSTINIHSYSYVLDSASYLTTVSGSSLVIYEGDNNFFDESTTQEGFQPEEMTAFVLALVVFVFLVVIVMAIGAWRDNRNKERERHNAYIAAGGYR